MLGGTEGLVLVSVLNKKFESLFQSQQSTGYSIELFINKNISFLIFFLETKAGYRPTPEVWFADRANTWFFLSRSFTEYFRLLTLHLGLPEWQFVFTDAGLSPISQQWFNFFAPVRLQIDLERRLGRATTGKHRLQPSEMDAKEGLMNMGKIMRRVNEHAASARTRPAGPKKQIQYPRKKNTFS